MKTTIEIRDDLLKAAKKRAIDQGVTLRAIVEAALDREMCAEGGETHVAARRRELDERLETGAAFFDQLVTTEQCESESEAEARLRLLPLPVFSDGEADLSLRAAEVVAEALRRRE